MIGMFYFSNLIFVFFYVSVAQAASYSKPILFGHEIELRDAELERSALLFAMGQIKESENPSKLSSHYSNKSSEHICKSIKKLQVEIEAEAAKSTEKVSRDYVTRDLGCYYSFIVMHPEYPFVSSNPWIAYTVDPFVIEVKGAPLTVEQMKKYEKQMQEQIFERPSRHGYKPSWFSNSTHISVDWASAFGAYPQQSFQRALNFITDWVNQDFATGTLNYDPHNAFGIRESESTLQIFANRQTEIMEYVGGRQYKDAARVFKSFRVFSTSSSTYAPEIRVHLEIIQNEDGEDVVSPESRVEIRALRGVRNYREYIDFSELLQARIHYLNRQYDQKWIELDHTVSNTIVSHSGVFKRYVEESGLSWKTYSPAIKRAMNPCHLMLVPYKLFKRKFTRYLAR